MIDFILQFNPVTQALVATLFTWALTAAGAALVFITRTVNQKLMDSMLGFAGGVMIAASFWSLLAPGIDMAEQMKFNPWSGWRMKRVSPWFLPVGEPVSAVVL